MGGNIPGGHFPGGIFQGGVWWVGIFPGEVFLEPVKIFLCIKILFDKPIRFSQWISGV